MVVICVFRCNFRCKTPPKSGVIVVCSGLERIGNSLKMRKNGWLCEALESWEFLHSQPSLAHDKCDIFWLTSFKSSIRAWLIKQSRVARNFLIACSSYHVTSTFWNECTLSSCLNVKELLNRNRCDIWSLSNCNRSQFHNHFFQKWKLNHLVPLETLN